MTAARQLATGQIATAQLIDDLRRLTRLCANISEAHSCALFLPSGLVTSDEEDTRHHREGTNREGTNREGTNREGTNREGTNYVQLVAAHSFSSNLIRNGRIQIGSGLLGWVAEQGRPIHMAPFEGDISKIGVYSAPEPIRCLVALPVPIPPECSMPTSSHGILLCDNTRSPSFSPWQVKLLEDLATEISRLIHWVFSRRESSAVESSWQLFKEQAEHLANAIGSNSVELLRLSFDNFSLIEERAGVSASAQQGEQLYRLVRQTLPPHFPITRLPQGDILIALDTMMSAFFSNKINALIKTLNERPRQSNEHGYVLSASISAFLPKPGRDRSLDIDAILKQETTTCSNSPSKAVGGARA